MLIYSLKNSPDFFPQALAEALRCNRTLEVLCLHEDQITDVGAKVPFPMCGLGPVVRLEVESHLTSAGAVTYDTYMTLKYAEYQ